MSAVLKPEQCRIRLMQDDDVPRIVAIEQRAYDFPWSATIFSDCLRVGYCCWVLEHASGISGYGIMSVAADESHILNVCIDGQARRRGLARLLMAHLLETAAGHGARIAFLEVRPTNLAAVNLYSSLGFRHVGTRRDYYPAHGGREDAYVLSTPLTPSGEHANKD